MCSVNSNVFDYKIFVLFKLKEREGEKNIKEFLLCINCL